MRWMLGVLLLIASCFPVPSLTYATQLVPMQTAAIATGNGVSLPVANKGVAGLSVTGTFVGTLTFEGSADGSLSWASLPCTTLATGAASTTTTTTGTFLCPVAGLTDIRARVSAWTSGTITVSGFPVGLSSSGGSAVISGTVTISGTVAIDQTTPGTTNGVSLTILLSCEDQPNNVCRVEQQFSFLNIVLAAPTTTVIKSGAGFLHSIVINKAAASGVITCYDNTAASGTVIATITSPATLLQNQIPLPYDLIFATGLTCVTATAAQDITVMYR